jgi:peptidoglycan/xylan/chitin deacetylase (PgdA/CDA1 family)
MRLLKFRGAGRPYCRVLAGLGAVLAMAASATPAEEPVTPVRPVELHQRIVPQQGSAEQRVALTLDACSGHFDADLLDLLIRERIPATLFVTRRWIRRNAPAVALIKAHPDLFEVEDHGANHVPAVIGPGREVYGIAGMADLAQLRSEVGEGARAVEQAFGVKPRWYRGATALYDPQAIAEIERMGLRIAGFSVNADAGATLPRAVIEKRLQGVRGGDVIIAHMNKPDSDTAEALAVGLPEIRQRGLVFVRLEQVELRVLARRPPRRQIPLQ